MQLNCFLVLRKAVNLNKHARESLGNDKRHSLSAKFFTRLRPINPLLLNTAEILSNAYLMIKFGRQLYAILD